MAPAVISGTYDDERTSIDSTPLLLTLNSFLLFRVQSVILCFNLVKTEAVADAGIFSKAAFESPCDRLGQ